MKTYTVRFFEDKQNGHTLLVDVKASDEWELSEIVDGMWTPEREALFDGVEW